MTIYLRQITASQEIPLGYFLNSTDGDVEETGLTIANTDIKLWKSGATTLANKNSGGATHISNGIYYAVLDATDTNTLGSLVIFCHVAGGLATKIDCLVLPAMVYDSLIAGTDVLDASMTQILGTAVSAPATAGLLDVNAIQISGDATAANNAESFFDGTGYAGTNNVIGTTGVNVSLAVSATTLSSVSSGNVAIATHNSFSQTITSTTTSALGTATDTWFAAKVVDSDSDDNSIILFSETVGLERLAKAAATSASSGSLTTSGSSGDWAITLTLDEDATSSLTDYVGYTLPAELKSMVSGSTLQLWTGDCTISRGLIQAY